MKVIASENYYQKKVREENRIELEMRRKSARLSPEEEEARYKERHKCLERAFERYEKEQAFSLLWLLQVHNRENCSHQKTRCGWLMRNAASCRARSGSSLLDGIRQRMRFRSLNAGFVGCN